MISCLACLQRLEVNKYVEPAGSARWLNHCQEGQLLNQQQQFSKKCLIWLLWSISVFLVRRLPEVLLKTPQTPGRHLMRFSQHSVSCSSTLNQNSRQLCHIVRFSLLCVELKLILSPDGGPQGPSWSLFGTHLVFINQFYFWCIGSHSLSVPFVMHSGSSWRLGWSRFLPAVLWFFLFCCQGLASIHSRWLLPLLTRQFDVTSRIQWTQASGFMKGKKINNTP